MSETAEGAIRQNPRTRRVRRVVLESAIEVLLTEGALAVNPSRVAAHADVARTTIYRHWPDQSSLLLATIDALTNPDYELESLGDVELDIRAALIGLRKRLVFRNVRHVFGALAIHAARDEGFAAAQRRFVEQLQAPVRLAIERAQSRGEIDGEIDARHEASLLAGPILYQHLVVLDDIPDELIEGAVSLWETRAAHT